MSNPNAPIGLLEPQTAANDYTSQLFIIENVLARTHVATLVIVKAVTNAGGVSPVGTVDVLPLISQLDGADNMVEHTTIYTVPYMRLQGGTDAIIIDPKVNDIGIAIFADRDITQVKVNKSGSRPGSKRRHDMADGLYMGGFLNGTPAQYIQFTAGGINIVSPSKITFTAPLVEVDSTTSFTVNAPQIIMNGTLTQGGGSYAGTATYNGNFTVNGVLTNNGKLVGSGLRVTGVQTGSGTSGVPV
jgi:hypothetical protein